MKTLYLVGGPMGAGKTAVCQKMKEKLNRSVFLDGDWCWDSHPFQVTEETKAMVLDNIRFLLNQFLRCSAYDHVIFCWVMHEQSILDDILAGVDCRDCQVKAVSLLCSPGTLRRRLEKDIANGLRTEDVIVRSMERLPLYHALHTIKIHTDHLDAGTVAERVIAL